MNSTILIDHRHYQVEICQKTRQPEDAPRLVIVAYQPNPLARQTLQVCIQTIQKYTPEPYELWVIDNHSPAENTSWLLEWPGINTLLNLTEPRSYSLRSAWQRVQARLKGQARHPYEASYANAIALELAARVVQPETKYFMTLHMDTMPCYSGWLSFLKSKIEQGHAAAGVRLDKKPTGEEVLHVLGYLVDFQLLRSLRLSFLPALPRYDVGDLVTVRLQEAGHTIFACRNTLWDASLEELIPASSPLHNLPVDRSLDDHGDVIFLHLGRGVRKSTGEACRGMSLEEWVQFARQHLLAEDGKISI
jgi:hypothetical protein